MEDAVAGDLEPENGSGENDEDMEVDLEEGCKSSVWRVCSTAPTSEFLPPRLELRKLRRNSGSLRSLEEPRSG